MKKALILGKGISGLGAEKALKSLGYSSRFFDDADGDAMPDLADISLVIVSPGVAITHPIVTEARKRSIEAYGELELGYRLCRCPIIAVTGTNGKTTVTELINRILLKRGLRSDAVGNVGKSLAAAAMVSAEFDAYVCEVSSFQLESTVSFAPDIAMITNISPDHLDRHGTMEEYARTKLRIAASQTEKNFLILSADDIPIGYLKGFVPRSHVLFVSTRSVVAGAYMLDGKLYYFDEFICDRANLKAAGIHNVSNALFAAAAARIVGVERSVIASVFAEFDTGEHRLQDLGVFGGKRYFDDSKGTNIDACLKACGSMTGDTALILGGSGKGYDYSELFDKLPAHITYITAIGETAGELEAAGARYGRGVIVCPTLEDAVHKCAASSAANVLLSPASASFDMFRDYKERGERFAEIVGKPERPGASRKTF